MEQTLKQAGDINPPFITVPTSNQFCSSYDVKDEESPRLDQEQYYLLRVPHRLRQVNERAYEPQLISIGPYHHGKPHLIEMEVHKHRCLRRTLERKGEKSPHRFLKAMNLKRAHKCYWPSLFGYGHGFEMMMLRDACFVVELFTWKVLHDDPILTLGWVQGTLWLDLLLLENQIPFFVLVGLYHVIKDPKDEEDFAHLVFSRLSALLPGPDNWKNSLPAIKDTKNIKHILSLIHDNWSPSLQGIQRHEDYCKTKEKRENEREEGGVEMKFPADEEKGVTTGTNHNCFKCKFMCCARKKRFVRKGIEEQYFLPCAIELQEAGIKFRNSTEDSHVKSLLDISFTNATMRIPTIQVDDSTEGLLRNFIAYEHYQNGSTYVIDYMILMDKLINTGKDVQLLRFSGIIVNLLGDDEAVAKMFNKLGEHVSACSETFYYEEISSEVKKHCQRRWNTWKAKLRHDYFHSPWAIISFFAALLIILLTIGQFISAVIPLVR